MARQREQRLPLLELPADLRLTPADLGSVERVHARSVTLASERLGVVSKLDLMEAECGVATPVEYKRGKRPPAAFLTHQAPQ